MLKTLKFLYFLIECYAEMAPNSTNDPYYLREAHTKRIGNNSDFWEIPSKKDSGSSVCLDRDSNDSL